MGRCWFEEYFQPLDMGGWEDRPLAIVGTGPSLRGFEFNALHDPRWRVLAVKEAVWDLPFADACVSVDIPWLRRRHNELAELAQRMPVWCALPDEPPAQEHLVIPGVRYLRRRRTCNRFSEDPRALECGGNSGFGALNFAYLKGARRIVLFGFDYTGGGHYCQERYTWAPRGHNAHYFPRWGENFRETLPQLHAAGARVRNASPGTTVDAFPTCTIPEGLEWLAAWAEEPAAQAARGEISELAR